MENNYECVVMAKLQKMRLERMRGELKAIDNAVKEWEKQGNESLYWYYKGQQLQLNAQIGYLDAELSMVEE